MLFNLSLSNTIQVGTLERGRKIGIKLLRRVFAPRKVERPPVVYNFILSMAVGPSGERWSGWSRNTPRPPTPIVMNLPKKGGG